eukprot:6200902-Pleurochrysis_carterae.AAC.1
MALLGIVVRPTVGLPVYSVAEPSELCAAIKSTQECCAPKVYPGLQGRWNKTHTKKCAREQVALHGEPILPASCVGGAEPAAKWRRKVKKLASALIVVFVQPLVSPDTQL